MKTNRTQLIIQIILIIIAISVAVITYPMLPDQIITHWNIVGEPDGWGSKLSTYLLILGLMLFIWLMMKGLPYLDPKKEKYILFQDTYQAMQSVILAFFLYVFAVSIYCNLYDQPSISWFMMIGMGILFIILGNFMGKIRQNYFVGIKTPWTLSDEDIWNKSHRLAGKLRVLGGLIMIIEAFIMRYIMIVFIIILVALVVAPISYSYRLHRQSLSKKETN